MDIIDDLKIFREELAALRHTHCSAQMATTSGESNTVDEIRIQIFSAPF